MTTSDRRRIAEEAAEWVDRLEEGDEKEKALFAEWLANSARHIEEFLRACAVNWELKKLGSVKALSKRAADVVVDHPTMHPPKSDHPAPAAEPISQLAAVYRDYPGLRVAVLRLVRDPEVAADILQDAAVTTLERLRRGEIADPENMGGYLYRVALNHLRNYRRKERSDLLSSGALRELRGSDESPDSEHVAGPRWAEVARQLLNEMPTRRDRELLTRFYLNDEGKERICRELKLSEEHFKRVIFRARNRFRELLGRRGFDLYGGHRKLATRTLFLAYDCRSRLRLDQLHVHLADLRREGIVTTWIDREISAGTSRHREVTSELEKASHFVPLVSRELLNSRYCYDLEMTRAVSLHQCGHLKITPLILEDCDWDSSPLGRFEPLPKSKPIGSWLNVDAAFEEVVAGLRGRLQGEPLL